MQGLNWRRDLNLTNTLPAIELRRISARRPSRSRNVELSKFAEKAWLSMRKPFDAIVEGLFLKNSRADKTAIELFLAGVRGWETGLRRRLDDDNPSLIDGCDSQILLNSLLVTNGVSRFTAKKLDAIPALGDNLLHGNHRNKDWIRPGHYRRNRPQANRSRRRTGVASGRL